MRLGLDIGTNSIGWWLYETRGTGNDATIIGVIDSGVRIFSDGRDPKSKTSLAVDRRAARAMRRRRDRYLRRRATLMKEMVKAGLMPADPSEAKALEKLDPFALRAKGLKERLPLTHLGRAFFHLNQRRGFKSNRKTDRRDNESTKISEASARLDRAMMAEGARTYGEFLHTRRQRAIDARRRVPTVRTRLSVADRGEDEDGKKTPDYDFYPERRHLEKEFCKLWKAQEIHHPDVLTDNLRKLLFKKIFFQRPLKKPEVGLCLFSGLGDVPNDARRLPKAHPLTQRRILYETVNQLRIAADGAKSRPLTREQRDHVIYTLDNKKPTQSPLKASMKLEALAKVLKLAHGECFTLKTDVREDINCDSVRASLSHPDRFGPRWSSLDWQAQWEVIKWIRDVESEVDHQKLADWLTDTHGLDADHAGAVVKAPLPESYGRLGLAATQAILEQLEADVVTYSDAVKACGWHHSNHRTGELLDRLPYYGKVLEQNVMPGTGDANDDEVTRFGRITNPTVHIGLNQLRRVVNKIIAVYGKPDQIVVELARDLKLSDKEKEKEIKRIKETTVAARRRSAQLEELGQRDIGHNRMLLRLWEDLGPATNRRCPYTGKTISVTMVFDGSCDDDHILPYSRTLDDSFSNRTLCLKEANREKRNRTPWEAWGGTPRWDRISTNLKNLAKNKRWRFEPDAIEQFEEKNDFVARALNDTRYLSRIARSYLDTLFTEGGHVWVVPGRLTAMLRCHWGLNSLLGDAEGKAAAKEKNRTDHRHHAIDAAVVAATDRSLLHRISSAANEKETEQSTARITQKISPPWEGFRDDIGTWLNKMIVSHRADHGRIDPKARKSGRGSTTGRLHNDTAYGIINEEKVVSRTPLRSLKYADIAITTKAKNIRDPNLQKALEDAVEGTKDDKKAFEKALVAFSEKPGPYQGIRRVRLVESLGASARVEIGYRADGRPLKAYKADSNHCYELWRLPDGKVEAQVITTFEANTGVQKQPHPAAKRLLRLFKRDMVALEQNGETVICYVQKLAKAGLFLAPHHEANADARNRDEESGFRLLQIGKGPILKSGLRRVFVDEIGHIRDPGPKG